MDKQHCVGCRDDFYNGKNELGVGECWLLKTAKLQTKYAIGWHTPMDKKGNFTKVKKPSCYRKPGQIAYLDELPQHLK